MAALSSHPSEAWMATKQTQVLARTLLTPAVALLFLWMIVPLGMTIWFSLLRYDLLDPGNESFAGLTNYSYFLTDPDFFSAIGNTLKLVGSVLIITVVGVQSYHSGPFLISWSSVIRKSRPATMGTPSVAK